MPVPDDVERRLSAVERDVAELREQQAATAADATAARVLAAGSDHDVSEVRAELRAHTGALNALRQSQVEAGRKLDRMDIRLDQMDGRLDQMDSRLDQMDGRFDQMDSRLDRMDGRLDRMDGRLGQMDNLFHAVDTRFDQMDGRLEQIIGLISGNQSP